MTVAGIPGTDEVAETRTGAPEHAPVKAAGAWLRRQLFALGRRVPVGLLARLRAALAYVELGALVEAASPGTDVVDADDRFGVFAVALEHLRSAVAPLYLEFGVFEGVTMRWWSEHLRSARARFVGFDSFEGLPEVWRPGFDPGVFRTQGPPAIDDERVSFVAGWFDETLPGFTPPDHDRVVINVDSDLYSSARTVLTWAEPLLRPGTLLYFDELTDRDHELRALQELRNETGLALRPLASALGGRHFLFVLT
jgi:hypothetical protein